MQTGLTSRHPWLRDAGIAAFLLALNAYIARDLFLAEYLSHMESIEAAYIGLARHIATHGFGLGWFPLWYCGVPIQNSYPPLLHLLSAIASVVSNVSAAAAHHQVTAAIYCLGPVVVYLMSRRLSGDWRIGAAAALAFSIVSPSAWLSHSVYKWAGAADPARYFAIVLFGDGPHVAAVTLIPAAILALHWAIEGRGPAKLYVAGLAAAAVVLTNWLGAFALALSVVSYHLARFAAGEPGLRPLLKTAAVAAIGYACALPWVPPSTIGHIRHNAQHVVGTYPLGAKQLLYLLPVLALGAALAWLLRKSRASLLTGFSCFLALFSSALVLGYDNFGVWMMPQPNRYHHEMDLALCVAAASIGGAVLKPMNRRWAVAILLAILAAGVFQARQTRRRARVVTGPAAIESTIEYRIADWLGRHARNRRVFLTGSTQFWLNAFNDTPQVGGGFAQGIVNSQIPQVHFGTPWTTGNGPGTITLLKLYGVAYVVVAEKGSRDAYPENWRDPAKFRGLLEEVFRDGGDVIYRVPLRSDSLAHVIGRDQAVRRSPINAVDLDPARALAAALDDPALPPATCDCSNPSDCTIRATLAKNQLLFVQINHHPGWHAYVNGQCRAIERDGLGFMTIDPGCEGTCELRLQYDGGPEMMFAKAAFVLVNALGLISLVFGRIRP